MSQILNSLVVSDQHLTQETLENIMSNNIESYVLTFTSYPYSQLSNVDREPDIIFIEETSALNPDMLHDIMRRFPKKTYVVLSPADEKKRRDYLRLGIDEVMSLGALESDLGRHLLEQLLTLKELAIAEARIEQSEERFRGIIEHSHDIIILLDTDGTVIYTSPAFGRQMGYETWEVLGQPFSALVHEEDRVIVDHLLKNIHYSDREEGRSIEFKFMRKDGIWRHFETIATNLLNTDTVNAIVLNSRDVTQQKEAEEELDKYRLHLEDLVERRTKELTSALAKEKEVVEQQRTFISMVSHEFRTPLTIIDGNAQIIQSRGENITRDMLEKRAGTIRTAVERLVKLIETMLSAGVIESGKLVMVPEKTSLDKLIRGVCTEQQEISNRHKIAVDIQGLENEVFLDKKLIRQVMTNLVSNAIKYSPVTDDIRINAHVQDNQAIISVQDFGVGIPEKELPKIFQKYFRASTSGGIPGSGLGLCLVKQYIELHNGQIGLQSAPGKGTTVTVRLPMDLKPAVN